VESPVKEGGGEGERKRREVIGDRLRGRTMRGEEETGGRKGGRGGGRGDAGTATTAKNHRRKEKEEKGEQDGREGYSLSLCSWV